jgi:ATP-binding cassette subfamily B protein
MYINQAAGLAREALNRLENLVSYPLFSLPAHPKKIHNHSISFRNVAFRYPGSNHNAVDGVNLVIPEGKAFALVGPSGGGKTTMAKLVARFWDVNQGQVCIGGTNVKEIAAKELMDHITFVFQHTRLFNASLLDNVRYGRPSASSEEIEEALGMAQCCEFIHLLPKGLNSLIGSGGTYLSGGEQQRILIARAMLKNAPIVILDEATAFTDPENEHLIQKALRKLMEGKTVLMIAHRLTSVQQADQIVVIDKGRVIEQGSHQVLAKKQGTYASMWEEYQRSVQWTLGKEARHVLMD